MEEKKDITGIKVATLRIMEEGNADKATELADLGNFTVTEETEKEEYNSEELCMSGPIRSLYIGEREEPLEVPNRNSDKGHHDKEDKIALYMDNNTENAAGGSVDGKDALKEI